MSGLDIQLEKMIGFLKVLTLLLGLMKQLL